MSSTKPSRAPMTRWLATQRSVLEQRLQRLHARTQHIGQHQGNEAEIGVGDQADHAQVHDDDQVVADLDVRAAIGIRAIEGALARIALGTYENCAGCGNVIGHARLEVMPEATLCSHCVALSRRSK